MLGPGFVILFFQNLLIPTSRAFERDRFARIVKLRRMLDFKFFLALRALDYHIAQLLSPLDLDYQAAIDSMF
jgi:hypothetical protein